jgi:hypothetical protein
MQSYLKFDHTFSSASCITDCTPYSGKKDPYCGTNGETYPNKCELYNAICSSGGKFDKAGKGACGMPLRLLCLFLICKYQIYKTSYKSYVTCISI